MAHGQAGKARAVVLAGRLTAERGRAMVVAAVSLSLTSGDDSSAMSFSSDASRPRPELSSSEATISIGWVARSR
jgi:hypothetical protein